MGLKQPAACVHVDVTLPVIALMACLPAEVEKIVNSAGLTDIVVKPFNPDELFRVLLKHLKG